MKMLQMIRLVAVALCAVSMGIAQAQTSANASASVSTDLQESTAGNQTRQQDHVLAKRVRHSLYKTKGLDASDITVFARSGAVTLVGTAADQGQIDLAGKVARGVSGVSSVRNQVIQHVKG